MSSRAFFRIVTLALLALLSQACTRKPEEIAMGSVKCSHCSMIIQDARFEAQAMTSRGRHLHFDSIECALSWAAQSGENEISIWVRDFSRPEQWLTLEDQSSNYPTAILVRSPRLRSPMGAGIAAFGNPTDAKEAAGRLSGNVEEKSQIITFLKKEWAGANR